MLQFLYSDVALHSLYNFTMLYLEVFRAPEIWAWWGRSGGERDAMGNEDKGAVGDRDRSATGTGRARVEWDGPP